MLPKCSDRWGNLLDQAHLEAFKVVSADELIQIDGEQSKGQTEMSAETKVLQKMDDVVCLTGVLCKGS